MNLSTLNPAIVIATLSLLISIFTYWRQRKRLTVTFDDKFSRFDSLRDVYLDSNLFSLPAPMGIQVGFSLVNPSHCNISIFDLKVVIPRTRRSQCILLKNLIPDAYQSCLLKIRRSSEKALLPEIPVRPSCLIHAGEYVRMDLVIIVDDDITLADSFVITFKSTDTSIFRRGKFSPSSPKRIYRTYEKEYKLSFDELTPINSEENT